VFLAFVLGDLGPYLFHRLCHESPLWRLHALHHSSEKMQLLSAGRNHPLHVFVAYSLQVVLLGILGAPAEVVMLHSMFSGVHGLVQHANIDLRFGWLNYIIATPELHMWHHSRTLSESNTNYGNHVIVWDLLLGTFFLPRRRPTTDMGLPHGTRFPRSFLGHMAVPFIWARISAEGSSPSEDQSPAVVVAAS
jgi:ornithine lipid hydroxylase